MGAPSCRVRCSTTHDETAWDAAPPVLFGGLKAAQCAQAIAHVLPGTPLLYSGQEVGSHQPLSLVGRTPIDWSTHPEMRSWTRTLLRVRTSHPALTSGPVAFSGNDEVIVVHRTCDEGGEHVACLVANVTDKPVRVEVDLGTGIEVRDVWTGRVAEGIQDLEASRGSVVCSLSCGPFVDRIIGSDFEPFGLGGSSSFMTSSRLLSLPLC